MRERRERKEDKQTEREKQRKSLIKRTSKQREIETKPDLA
jgi:hypothetical protein